MRSLRRLLRRLKPYGAVTPRRLNRPHLRAWALGVRDGWEQPFSLDSTTNIEHLADLSNPDYFLLMDSLDGGCNAGQWLRSPFLHEQPDRT